MVIFLVFVLGFLFVLTLRAARAETVVRDMQKVLWLIMLAAAFALSWYKRSFDNLLMCTVLLLLPLRGWGIERCCLCSIFLLVWEGYCTNSLVTALALYGMFCLQYGYRGKERYSKDVLTRIFMSCTLYASGVIAAAFLQKSFDMKAVMALPWMAPIMCSCVLIWSGLYPLPTLIGFSRQLFKSESLAYWFGAAGLLEACASCPHAKILFVVLNGVVLVGACVLVLRSSYDVWAHMLTTVWLWLTYICVLSHCGGFLQMTFTFYVLSVLFLMRAARMSNKLPTLWSLLCGMSVIHPAVITTGCWQYLPVSAKVLLVANMVMTVFFGATCWTTQHFSCRKILKECWRPLLFYHSICAAVALFLWMWMCR